MKRTLKPTIFFTGQANRDLERCRLFLQRMGLDKPERRIRQIHREAQLLRNSPKLYPIEEVHAITGLEFRRKNVGQFALIYAFLEPTPSQPAGAVSIRRVRHGAEEDVLFRVEERRGMTVGASRGLSTREHFELRRC